jgi:hypothetical protein
LYKVTTRASETESGFLILGAHWARTYLYFG